MAKFFSTSSAAFLVRALAAGIAFLMNVVVTRTLGPHEAGLFFLGQTFLVVFAMLSRVGLDHLIVRYVSIAIDQKKAAVANAVLARAAIISIPIAVIATASCFALSDGIATNVVNQSDFAPTLRAIAFCIVPFTLYQVLSFGLQGRGQVATSIVINTAFFPAMLLLVAYSGLIGGSESSRDLSIASAFIATLNALVALALWIRSSSVIVDFDGIDGRKLMASAIPLCWISIILLANAWLPLIVLAGYVEPTEIAKFSNAQKTAALVGFLLLAINSAASPTFAAMYERNQQEALREFASRVNGFVLVTTIPIFLVVFAFSSQILNIFGPQFSQAAWLLRVLLLGQFVNAATGSVGYLLVMSGHERSFRNATAISATVGVVLCFWLIPIYGANGAAVATSVVISLSNILSSVQVYYRLGINVLKPDLGYWMKAFARLSHT